MRPGLRRLFFYPDRTALSIEFNHAVALRVTYWISEYCAPMMTIGSGLQLGDQFMAMEQVVAQY